MSRIETKKRVRRVHTREFKVETVALVRTGGRNAGQVARELGLADSLVRTWVHQAEVDARIRRPSRRSWRTPGSEGQALREEGTERGT